MAGLFRVAAAFLGNSGWRRYWALASALWLEMLAGALPGAAVCALLLGSHPWIGSGLGAFLGLVGLLLGAAAGVVLRATRLPKNRFGLCTGYTEPSPGRPLSLTDWLNNEINWLAGHAAENPLTFGDLSDAGVTLKMICTCLTWGRPYTLPFEKHGFYFLPEEMRSYFPAPVVEWMVKKADTTPETPSDEDPVDTSGFVRLPGWRDLPVIVAARLSLSFPLLFCAVPLYALDRTRRRCGADEPVPQKRVPGDALGRYEPRRPEVTWFSDGGICSNFPLHLFDSPLPRWPTFGLNLRDQRPDFPDPVWTPDKNGGGIQQEWKRWSADPGATISFVGSIVDAARNWTDTLQTMVPGYRDRIAHIYLSEDEGGLNLNMPREVIDKIAGFGTEAAERLADRFLRGRDQGAATPMTWDNHRWIRYRSTMEVMKDFLSRFSKSLRSPEPGDRSYAELVRRQPGEPPNSYRFAEAEREGAADITLALGELGQEMSDCDFSKNAPHPEPGLRVRPKY
jgi:hypothetical protein